jgi:hypothetical protein
MEPKQKEHTVSATAAIGPGSYNIDYQKNGEKIIVSS